MDLRASVPVDELDPTTLARIVADERDPAIAPIDELGLEAALTCAGVLARDCAGPVTLREIVTTRRTRPLCAACTAAGARLGLLEPEPELVTRAAWGDR